MEGLAEEPGSSSGAAPTRLRDSRSFTSLTSSLSLRDWGIKQQAPPETLRSSATAMLQPRRSQRNSSSWCQVASHGLTDVDEENGRMILVCGLDT